MKRYLFLLVGVAFTARLFAAAPAQAPTNPTTFQTNLPAGVAVMVLSNPVAATSAGAGTARNFIMIENNSASATNLVYYGHNSGVATNGVALWGPGGSVGRLGYEDNSQWWLWCTNAAPCAVEYGTLTK